MQTVAIFMSAEKYTTHTHTCEQHIYNKHFTIEMRIQNSLFKNSPVGSI